MSAKAFFDTNVLLYMYSDADSRKRDQAKELFAKCASFGGVVVSTQVVQEFFSAGLRKLTLPREELRTATNALLELPLVLIGPAHIIRAMEGEERYRISFWDALILAAAESVSAGVVYTEDLNDGQQYGRVVVHNPFSPR
jgi:predicted nucleic acid-binding protein